MGIVVERSGETSWIRLEGAVDVTHAGELKAALAGALQSSKRISVTLESATYLDVTAVQLLWAARREAKKSGVKLTVESEATEAVVAALKDAGFEGFSAAS